MKPLLIGGLIVISVSATVAQIPQSQLPPPADAAISGTVTDAVTKQPITDAIVELGWPQAGREFPQFSHRQFTDARGRFVFTGLPAGSNYVIRASKTGYFTNAAGALGLDNATGPAIELRDAQWVSNANVTLWPPASISGTVTDETGEPVIGVFVRLVAQLRLGGATHWAVGQLMRTDDRGMYRAGQLRPGRYYVMVPSVQATVPTTYTPASRTFFDTNRLIDDVSTRLAVNGYPIPPPATDGRRLTYPITFAGSRMLADARAADVQAGAAVTGVDVRLEPVAALRISGVADGTPEQRANLFLRLVPEGLEDFGMGGEAAATVTTPDGMFTFSNVPAGRYVIEARSSVRQYLVGSLGIFSVPRLPTPPGMGGGSTIGGDGVSMGGFGYADVTLGRADVWVRQPIVVGARDVTGLAVRVQQTARMSGHLIGETHPEFPKPTIPPRFVELQSVTGSSWQGLPRSVSTRNVAPGQFAIEGVVPGAYVLQASESGWMLKSVVVQGRDRTNAAIEFGSGDVLSDTVVTFTNAIPTVAGRVQLDATAPVAAVAVILFPVEKDLWTDLGLQPARLRSVLVSSTGAFEIRTLPAGDYFAAAVPISRMHDWRDAEFLVRLTPHATRFTVRWGERTSIDLKLLDVR